MATIEGLLQDVNLCKRAWKHNFISIPAIYHGILFNYSLSSFFLCGFEVFCVQSQKDFHVPGQQQGGQ